MVQHSGDDGPNVTEEPPLRCYMRRSCTDVDDRGRLLSGVRCVRDGLRLDVQATGRLRVVARQGQRVVVHRTRLRRGVHHLPLALPVDGRWTVRALTRTGWYVHYATERRVTCERR
jgi:hypothetical protein